MPAHENLLFTPTEAAVLTRLSVKAVNNAIDRKTIPTVAGSRAGYTTRLLDLRALLSLTLERRLVDRLMPQARREVFNALAAAPRSRVSLEGGFLMIDPREPRRELATLLRTLRRAREAVVSDSDIMGGDPVFRGTRVPVHTIAMLLGQGQTEAELLHDYPRLTVSWSVWLRFMRRLIRRGGEAARSRGTIMRRHEARGGSWRQSEWNEVSDR